MYISELNIKNFRKYADLVIKFNKGMNVLVGENNSGKTAIIDAIRYVIDPDWYSTRIQDSDFMDLSKQIEISLKMSDLTDAEQHAFLEYLTFEEIDGGLLPFLYLSFTCSSNHTYRMIMAGKDGDIRIEDQQVKEQIHMAYLRPLRDAENELSPKQQSRLSKILQNFSHADPTYITDKAAILNALQVFNSGVSTQNIIIEGNRQAKGNLEQLLLKPNISEAKTRIGIPTMDDPERNFRQISEKLKLDFDVDNKQGLGYYNLLFMAIELILLRKESGMGAFLLIEEPEAHIHPQLQYNLLRFIAEETRNVNFPLQIFITTHSPNISSKVNVADIIWLADTRAFSLNKSNTKAQDNDYVFLTKFLDVTKANMFFAKGLIFVERFSEEILFPVFAKMMGYSTEEYGVSVISVNGTSHERYAKILQRVDDSEMPLPCSFVRDADQLADDTLSDKQANIETQNMLKFFKSSERTLEFDIAKNMWGLSCEILKSLYSQIPEDIQNIESSTFDAGKVTFYNKMKGRGKSEFAYALAEKLLSKENEWNELKTKIPDYIQGAIKHVFTSLIPGPEVVDNVVPANH